MLNRLLRLTWCLLPVIALSSCSLESSPWTVKVDGKYQNLTDKNLEKLKRRQPVYTSQGQLRFAIIGDPQGTPEDFQRSVETLNKRTDINFILILGDLTDYALLHEYEWAAEVIAASALPILTVIGNHDAIAHGKKIYNRMFGPFDYSFYFEGYKFLMWNNNLFEFDEQNFEWLDIESDAKSIVASHVPPEVDIHSQADLDVWYDINQRNEIVGSLHGHRGGTSSFLWQKYDTPYYVVARNRGERFALVTIEEDDSLGIIECHRTCPAEASP